MSATILPPSPPLAQVRTPQGGIWYIAYAREHRGFIVQRRYRGVGEPSYNAHYSSYLGLWANHEYVEAYLEPYLNPDAVQAAGLTVDVIRQWVWDNPGEIFAHPTYAPLCLQWGDNAHGYLVEKLVESVLTPDAMPFTPHTCWETGTTYYQWAAAPNVENDLWEQIHITARLRDHVREIGCEGQWSGWYTTDRQALDQALGSMGRRVALAQPRMCYGVFMQDAGETEVLMTSDTAEEARAYFAALPEASGTYSNPAVNYIFTGFGSWVQWPGQAPEWVMMCEKYAIRTEFEAGFLQLSANNYLPIKRMRRNELYEQDMPLSKPLVTLAAVLGNKDMIRWRLAEVLGWSIEELSEREQDPGRLTLAEVERIGELTQRPVGQLLLDLGKEAQVRTLMAKQANARRAAALTSGGNTLR